MLRWRVLRNPVRRNLKLRDAKIRDRAARKAVLHAKKVVLHARKVVLHARIATASHAKVARREKVASHARIAPNAAADLIRDLNHRPTETARVLAGVFAKNSPHAVQVREIPAVTPMTT